MQFVQDVQSLYYVSEDCMLAIEPGTGHECYEELRAVGVGAGIGHRQQSWYIVFQFEVLVGEGASVYGLTSGAVVVGEVSSLGHEVGDDAVEMGIFVPETFFVGAESSEVGCGFGGLLVEEVEDQFADLLVAKIDLEEDVFKCHSKDLIMSEDE